MRRLHPTRALLTSLVWLAACGSGEPPARRGAPWDKPVNAASELGATLIVVGAHGQRGPMRNALIGSVATRVVATSMQSVLVVRQKLG